MARANRVLSESEVSPNYQKLLDLGDARTVGDILAAGSEASIRNRLRSFADAGATDVSLRVVPIGETRDGEAGLLETHPRRTSRRWPDRSERTGYGATSSCR